jgi:hypothetical protein
MHGRREKSFSLPDGLSERNFVSFLDERLSGAPEVLVKGDENLFRCGHPLEGFVFGRNFVFGGMDPVRKCFFPHCVRLLNCDE